MTEPTAMGFGTLLRQLRTGAGLTQEELAHASTVSYRSISDLERGVNQTARKETARLLADALGLSGTGREAFLAAARGRPAAGAADTRSGAVGQSTDGSAGDHPELTGDAEDGVGSTGAAGASRTLPRDISSFTGREIELDGLVGGVGAASGVVEIHAIGGMAGVGKTAFAVHAAHRLGTRFPDGQIFLPLHGHTPGRQPVDPADALFSLLLTAGVSAQQIPPGLEARMNLWRDHLAGRKLLLLLDDASGSEQVRPLLPGTGGSLVLITTRLHLTALEDAHVIGLDALPPQEAGVLFARLAARPGLNPDDPAVREVTRLSGYLPLAIGMLGRQLRHHPAWTAADLAADLTAARDRLELMTAEEQSVAAAFDLSYRDLTPPHRRLLRMLCLHPGPDIDQYAAAALDATSTAVTRRALDTLYDHHLLTEPQRGRYRLHDLIRAYGRARAGADPPTDRDAALARLLAHYLCTARAADQYLARRASSGRPMAEVSPPGPLPVLRSRDDALAWMTAERLNLHAAADYAAAAGRPGYVIALAAAMHGFLRTQGHWDEATALLRTALGAARLEGDRLSEASALIDLGDMQYMTGDYPAATASFTQALQIATDTGDRLSEAEALKGTGMIEYETGDTRGAAGSFTRALGCLRELGNQLEEANVVGLLGMVQQATGDYAAAAASEEQALRLHRKLGNRYGEANALNFLGVVEQTVGDHAAAVAHQEEALRLHRELGNRYGEANALHCLGAAQQACGDLTAAAANQEQALRLYREVGYRMGEGNVLNSLGVLRQAEGDYLGAAAHLEQALRLFRELGVQQGEAEVLNSMGGLALASGQTVHAQQRHEEALAIAARVGLPPEQARALEGIGRCHLGEGRRAEASAALQQAQQIFGKADPAGAERIAETLREHHL